MTKTTRGFTRNVGRRGLIAGGLAAFLYERRLITVFADAAQPATPVSFEVPGGACDCHTHIFGDPQRFAFWSGRPYTPETATVNETRALHRALHIERIVIVNSLVYGTDNSCMIDALRRLGGRARGIALIDDKTPDTQLDGLAHAGVRGVRLNFVDLGVPDSVAARQQFRATVKRLAGRDWHIQIRCELPIVEALQDEVMVAPLPVVFDHFAGARASPWSFPDRLCCAAKAHPFWQGLRQDFGCLSYLRSGARVFRCRATGTGANCRKPSTRFVGDRLAPPGFIASARPPPI